jgi:hypothetical protein
MSTKIAKGWIDWDYERDRIDLAKVATALLGPAPGRRGDRGRLWWRCPFHEDRNPSFAIRTGERTWHCFGCGERGDAISLVMRIKGFTFPEARAYLTGATVPSGKTRPRPGPEARPEPKPPEAPPKPSGMPEDAALALVTDSEARLWSVDGADARVYLESRGLSGATIRAARLGWTPRADGVAWKPPGLVLPWFDGGRLVLVKVRPDDAWRDRFPPEGKRPPKYLEAYRDPARLLCYPSPEAIRPGRALVIVEGELDALLLGQELRDLAPVITLGSASDRRRPAILGRMLPAAPWYVAMDADDAGDKAAAKWTGGRTRRVRPPEPFKDWTDAQAGGINLARWWTDRLGGNEAPPLYSWDDLSTNRWGPAVDDPTPGIVIDRPDRTRMRRAMEVIRGQPGDADESGLEHLPRWCDITL